MCSVFSILIRSLGYQEDFVAHDGTEIVEAVLSGISNPDLIIMDYRMPNMNGMDAAQKILKAKPDVRIIIASADDTIKPVANSAGMKFAQKPFSMAELSRMIKESL
jgi:CheY-like chemotaxis protein